MLEPGARIDGRFVVEALIGQGGLAEVYRVRHVELGSLHALKLLVWKKKQLEERLILEGRIQAQLRHPNVVAVTDLVRHDGQVGLLMEYVDHESLDDFLVRSGAIPPADALQLLAPILSGVTAAHDAGVLHRDLKPANVMLARSASGILPKVTDFGIAKVVEEVQAGRTAAGVTMGTPGYLAPEQILDSADADLRADVFALGAILYEMIAGRRAFADANGEVSVRSTLEGEVVPLDELVDGLDKGVASAVARSLSRRREDRFEDCRAFARALYPDRPELLAMVIGRHVGGPISLDSSIALPQGGMTLQPIPEPSLETFLPVEQAGAPAPSTKTSSRWPALLLVGVGVFGLVLVASAVWVASQTPAEAPPEGPAVVVADPAPEAAPPAAEPLEVVTPAPSDVAVVAPAPPPPVPVAEPAAAEPSPVVQPEPTPAVQPEPAPVVEPEVTLEPAPAAEPEPVVEPEPAVVAAPEPAPKPLAIPDFSAFVGKWSGTANSRPLELRVASSSGGVIAGELTFYLGPTPRTVPAEGSADAETGQVVIRGGDFVLKGTAAGPSMTGTYAAGKKVLPWTLVKGG
ncbi:MAG: serine/threonine protein kinase [Proteobacteria bacterium]|nr:serine/threonine protein kinase [Pseudomonadota bacterium]